METLGPNFEQNIKFRCSNVASRINDSLSNQQSSVT